MSKDFWDSRYSEQEFAYGTDPNEFLKEQIEMLKTGTALFLGERGGRNAVYASKIGWQVYAVDFGSSAKDKALKLAEENKVTINYEVSDLNDYTFKETYHDLVVMIFVHLLLDLRRKVFYKSIQSLKQNGKFIIEAFGKDQINNASGGPRSLDLPYSEKDILDLVNDLKTIYLESKTTNLEEGEHHKSKADVIRYVGVKNF
jgi:SAM-dependent methyltransferase